MPNIHPLVDYSNIHTLTQDAILPCWFDVDVHVVRAVQVPLTSSILPSSAT